MATIDADAILTRIRSVLEDNAGSLRTIAASRFDGGLWGDLSADEKSKRATYRPITEASIESIEPHEARPTVVCNVGLLSIGVLVTVVRHVGPEHMGTDSLRDDVKALAANDADVIAQALEYPGNLDRPTTGIVSGLLRHVGSKTILSLADNAAGTVTTEHEFTGIVQTAPIVTAPAVTPGYSLGYSLGYNS